MQLGQKFLRRSPVDAHPPVGSIKVFTQVALHFFAGGVRNVVGQGGHLHSHADAPQAGFGGGDETAKEHTEVPGKGIEANKEQG